MYLMTVKIILLCSFFSSFKYNYNFNIIVFFFYYIHTYYSIEFCVFYLILNKFRAINLKKKKAILSKTLCNINVIVIKSIYIYHDSSPIGAFCNHKS